MGKIIFEAPDKLHKRLKKVAKSEGLSMSAWLRLYLIEKLFKPAGRKSP